MILCHLTPEKSIPVPSLSKIHFLVSASVENICFPCTFQGSVTLIIWAGAPSCYLELLDKLQKWICRTVGPSLATSLEPLVHHRNVVSLSLFYRYYFGRCSAELAELVPLPYSRGRSTHYSDKLHDFSVTIPRCYKDVYVNSFFPRTARLWNSLPIECFALTYDLSGFKSRINRYLLTVSSFKIDFLYDLTFLCFFFL